MLIYLFFLVILGLPIMVMEFAAGRASRVSVALSFDRLEPKGTKWHWYKYGAMAGNYLLMMFYTTIGGWMLLYFVKMASGKFDGLNAEEIAGIQEMGLSFRSGHGSMCHMCCQLLCCLYLCRDIGRCSINSNPCTGISGHARSGKPDPTGSSAVTSVIWRNKIYYKKFKKY